MLSFKHKLDIAAAAMATEVIHSPNVLDAVAKWILHTHKITAIGYDGSCSACRVPLFLWVTTSLGIPC